MRIEGRNPRRKERIIKKWKKEKKEQMEEGSYQTPKGRYKEGGE